MNFRRLLGAGIAGIMLFSSVPVYAQSIFDNGDGGEDTALAGEYLTQIIQLIQDNYIGGEVTVEELVEAAIEGMAHSLDEYTEYYTQEQYSKIAKSIAKEIYSPNIIIAMGSDGYPFVQSMNEGGGKSSGMRNRDKILSVNDVDLKDMSYDEVMGILTSETRKTLKIKVYRRKTEIDLNVSLTATPVTTINTVSDITTLLNVTPTEKTSKVGYIKMSAVGDGTAAEFRTALRELARENKSYLILDMRGNIGGYVAQAVEICKLIVPAGTIITTRDKNGEVVTYTSTLEKSPFTKMVVLVDQNTASASEIIVSALQDSGAALVVGQQTYGKGVMQSVTDLNGMGIFKMTAYEYFSRNGRKVNGVGVSPNVEVNDVLFLTTEDKLEGSKVKAALALLGFNTNTAREAQNAIGDIQKRNGLQITYTLDEATVNNINTQIYTNLSLDRTLTQGYYSVTN